MYTVLQSCFMLFLLAILAESNVYSFEDESEGEQRE